MLKELEKIHKRNQEIYKDYPAKRANLEAQLKDALEDLNAAKAEQDAADDLTRYDAAAEAVKRAELRVKFAETALNKLDGAPRMTEQEYMVTVGTCQGIVAGAAEEYRKKALDLMEALKDAQDKYKGIVSDVNKTLIELDQSANVLQTMHKNRVDQYTDGEGGYYDVSRPDPKEWERHAVRFYPADAARMGTECRTEEEPYKQHDSVLAAAWTAVYKGFPHRTF